MRKELRFFFILFLFIILSTNANAAKRYWVAANDSIWNSTRNWSATSGGASGASVPGSNDTAYFNAGSVKKDTFDINVSVKRIEISSAYTGIIIQGTKTFTIGTSGAVLSGGTFSGGSASITVSGSLTISGTAFTSTSGTLTLTSTYTLSSGSFTHNSGLVYFNPASAKTYTGSTTFNRIEFNPTANASTLTFSSGTTFTTTDLTVSGTHQTTFVGTGTIDVKGDITITNSYYTFSSATLITITGTGSQHIYGHSSGSGFHLPALTINKSSDTLHLHNTIYVAGNWTYTAGVIDAGSSTIAFGYALTISGTFTVNNISFDGTNNYNYSMSSANITANGNVSLIYNNSAGYVRLNGGTIHAKGNVSVNNTTNNNSTYGGGTTVISIDGTGSQTLTGSNTIDAGFFPAITINKSSGTLTLVKKISTTDNWTYTTGTLSTGTSTVCFSASATISGSHALKNVTFMSGTYTISSGTTITVDSTLTLAGSSALILNTGAIHAKGDIAVTNSATNGTGTATITINGDSTQTFTGTTTAGQGKMPNVVINKSSTDTLKLVNSISMYGNWTYTDGIITEGSSTLLFANTLTISGSHNLFNVTFSGGAARTFTIASGTILTINGTMSITGSADATINTGTIYAKGNITVTNTATTTTGSASLVINGDGKQTLTGSGTAGQGRLPKITIDKDPITDDTLVLASVITVYGDWIYTKGNVDPGNSTVVLYGTANLDGQASGLSTRMSFYTLAIAANTRTLTGNIDVNNSLSIGNGATLSAGSNSIYCGGTWSNTGGTWTYGTSTVIFDGSTYKQIKRTTGGVAATETFYNLSFNRSGASQTLANPVVVNNVLTLTKGHIKTDTAKYLLLIDGATLSGGSDSAYVHGAFRKTGNDAFIFPLGDTTLSDNAAYHPLAISAPTSTTDNFQAQYFALTQAYGDSLVDSLASISNDEYWTLERKVGTSNVTATISWNRNASDVTNYDDLRVANWNGVYWQDLGASAITITSANSGNISATFSVNFAVPISPIIRGRNNITNPYFTLQRKLDGAFYYVSNGKLSFKYDEEYNDTDRKLSFNIYGDHNDLLTSDALIPASMLPLIYTVYGDNRYQLNLADCAISPNGYLPNGYYVLEVINEKNEKRYLRFKNTSSLIYVICNPNPN